MSKFWPKWPCGHFGGRFRARCRRAGRCFEAVAVGWFPLAPSASLGAVPSPGRRGDRRRMPFPATCPRGSRCGTCRGRSFASSGRRRSVRPFPAMRGLRRVRDRAARRVRADSLSKVAARPWRVAAVRVLMFGPRCRRARGDCFEAVKNDRGNVTNETSRLVPMNGRIKSWV